jgi:V8-like Glu-specific endopeptidase
MDLNNLVIRLCVEGSQAEFAKRPDDARTLYQQAWDTAQDDYEKCIAAHYVARMQSTPEDTFRWNQIALTHAKAVTDDRVQSFYPSLYLNMGQSYEVLGNSTEANRYYDLAAALGVSHRPSA